MRSVQVPFFRAVAFALFNLFLGNPLLQLKFWILRNYPWVNSGDIQKPTGQLWKALEDWVI